MAGKLEVRAARSGGFIARAVDPSGRVLGTASRPTREAALAAVRVTEQAPPPAHPVRGEAVRSLAAPATETAGSRLSDPAVVEAVKAYMASPAVQARLAEIKHREEAVELREQGKRRIGPLLGDESSQVGTFLAERFDELMALAPGQFRESSGRSIPRAPTRWPEQEQNTDVDWLVAQSHEYANYRLNVLNGLSEVLYGPTEHDA